MFDIRSLTNKKKCFFFSNKYKNKSTNFTWMNQYEYMLAMEMIRILHHHHQQFVSELFVLPMKYHNLKMWNNLRKFSIYIVYDFRWICHFFFIYWFWFCKRMQLLIDWNSSHMLYEIGAEKSSSSSSINERILLNFFFFFCNSRLKIMTFNLRKQFFYPLWN